MSFWTFDIYQYMLGDDVPFRTKNVHSTDNTPLVETFLSTEKVSITG